MFLHVLYALKTNSRDFRGWLFNNSYQLHFFHWWKEIWSPQTSILVRAFIPQASFRSSITLKHSLLPFPIESITNRSFRQLLNCFLTLSRCHFCSFHKNDIIQYVIFCLWLLSFIIMPFFFIIMLLIVIHGLAVVHLFSFPNSIPLFGYLSSPPFFSP